MRIIFTCPCGNFAEVEADSWDLAEKAALISGWDAQKCPRCQEVQDDENA